MFMNLCKFRHHPLQQKDDSFYTMTEASHISPALVLQVTHHPLHTNYYTIALLLLIIMYPMSNRNTTNV